jgi:hypothetical protein
MGAVAKTNSIIYLKSSTGFSKYFGCEELEINPSYQKLPWYEATFWAGIFPSKEPDGQEETEKE